MLPNILNNINLNYNLDEIWYTQRGFITFFIYLVQ